MLRAARRETMNAARQLAARLEEVETERARVKLAVSLGVAARRLEDSFDLLMQRADSGLHSARYRDDTNVVAV